MTRPLCFAVFYNCQACLRWVAEEEEDSDDEEAVPEEWHAAATAAGCSDVDDMLRELGERVSMLEQVPLNP